MRFLGLGLQDRAPDARTIWLFREKLTKAGAIKGLFERFDAALRTAGYIAMSGQIVDAAWWPRPGSATPTRRRRRSRRAASPTAGKRAPESSGRRIGTPRPPRSPDLGTSGVG
jgi:IS5 family transposase